MGCGGSKHEADDEDQFFDDDDGDENGDDELDDLDDLQSQHEDGPLLVIDGLVANSSHTPQDGPVGLKDTSKQHPSNSTEKQDIASASLGASRRRWDDEEDEEGEASTTGICATSLGSHQTESRPSVDAPPSLTPTTAAPIPVPGIAQKRSFLTAGSAFRTQSNVSGNLPTPKGVSAPTPLSSVAAANPLAGPVFNAPQAPATPAVSPLLSGAPSYPSRSGSAGTTPQPIVLPFLECHQCDAQCADVMVRQASDGKKNAWRQLPPVGPPALGKLTNPGLRNIEMWLDEVGLVPEPVPSLVASPVSAEQALNRRALNSNDRIIRSITERRRPSSVASSDDDDNARRRSSARIRSRQVQQQGSTSDDGDHHAIMADFEELEQQAGVIDEDDGDNSSRHTLRSEDNVRTSRHASLEPTGAQRIILAPITLQQHANR